MPVQGSGTIKYKNRKTINIGLIICLMIILYFVAYFCDYIFNKKIDLYEVTQGYTSSGFDGQYTALVIRDENIVTAKSSGYINFFAGDESPVYVGQQAYLIDQSGELSFRLNQAAQNMAILNENDLTILKDSLYDFKTSFKIDNYYETYHFKYQLESQIMELVNTSIFDNNDLRFSGVYNIYDSELAGIAVHYIDNMESLTIDSFDASSFKKNTYSKTIVRSNDYIEYGDPVYKVITSEDWNLVIQINNPDAFRGMDVVSIEFLKDNITANANFELITRGGNYYGVLSLGKYMVRYASERYLQIAFTDDIYSGLKVPETAVTKKQYLAVPEELLTKGGNSSQEGFPVKTEGPANLDTVVWKYPRIVLRKDGICYIPMDEGTLKNGDVIVMTDSNNEFTVGMTAFLNGVYVYSSGTSVFRFVDIIGQNNGYYIVRENTVNGLRMYDQVYTDYKRAESDK